MTAQTILPANTLSSGGYDVANSVRFNRGDAAYMHKTPSSAGNVDVWTFSAWIKVAETGGHRNIFAQKGGDGTSQRTYILLNSSGQVYVSQYTGSASNFQLVPNRLLRDESAWYHIVVAVDTTQGTDTNRLKLYINGVQETSFESTTYPSQNLDTYVNAANQPMAVGYDPKVSSRHFGGYMAEVVLIDGQQLAPDQFGEFDSDSGIWKPIDVSDLTFGTNGFYLDFEDSSNLGNDANGGTDLTEVNLAATDQSTDTCTNNFSTMNPLSSNMTLTEGNLNVADPGNAVSTFSVASGKWYVEMKATNDQNYNPIVGIATDNSTAVTNPLSDDYPGNFAESHGYDRTGTITSSNATNQGSLTTSQDDGDIIGLAVDLDSGTKTAQWYVNGSSVGSAVTLVSSESYVFMTYASGSQAGTGAWNFGSPSYANSSGNADGNGFGNFEYAPPSGFLALCTKNLGSNG